MLVVAAERILYGCVCVCACACMRVHSLSSLCGCVGKAVLGREQ